jgi:iron complex outermembrane receptor protein
MKISSKRFAVTIVFIISSLFMDVTVSVSAETKDMSQGSAITMEEFVVTATRDREEVRQVPANVSVITSQQIEQSGATTVVEVLNKLESIQFRDYSGNSSQSVVDMRGFGGDNPFGKTLVMLDGRKLNRPDMSSINWLQIPLDNMVRAASFTAIQPSAASSISLQRKARASRNSMPPSSREAMVSITNGSA